jgi:hypothetical protein
VDAIALFIICVLIMKQVLESKGWVMFHECLSCGHKQHYSHSEKKGYEIRIKLSTKTFSILINNNVIGGPFFEYEIESKLLNFNL